MFSNDVIVFGSILFKVNLNISLSICSSTLDATIKLLLSFANHLKFYQFKIICLCRVLLDWIAGLLNPDCNPVWWIGLWMTIQNQNRILDYQSSFCISIQIQKQSYFLSRNQKLMVNLAPAIKPSYFLSIFV